MTSCLVIYGLPGSGKTYTSQIVAKNLNLKLVIFDVIINIISEYIRKHFGENQFASQFENFLPHVFEKNSDIEGFKNDLDRLIFQNEKFFETFYSKLLTNKSSSINEDSKASGQLFDLAKNGEYLEPFSKEILNLVLRYLVKDASFFVIEGYLFGKKSDYRKTMEELFKEIQYLGCFRNQNDSSYYYEFQGNKLTSIEEIQEKIKSEIHLSIQSYQYFSGSGNNSRANSKLTKLGLPENMDGKTVLDLGCNEGFFCFESEKRGAKVIGIEKSEYWYNLAIERKKESSSFVNFLNQNWDDLSHLNYKFDLILFLGAFHYLKNNQLEMLKTIFDKMKKNGLLILEVGLLDKNENKWVIEDIKRPKGDVCQYTNKQTIIKLLSDAGFSKILFYGEGELVVGDDIPRHIIHATKTEKIQDVSIQTRKQSGIKTTEYPDKINLYDVENMLLRLYNKNSFYREIFNFGYKILKKLS